MKRIHLIVEITTNTSGITLFIQRTELESQSYINCRGYWSSNKLTRILTWDLSNYKPQVGSVGEGIDFSGVIDDLIIYKNVLTDDEIKNLYGKESLLQKRYSTLYRLFLYILSSTPPYSKPSTIFICIFLNSPFNSSLQVFQQVLIHNGLFSPIKSFSTYH